MWYNHYSWEENPFSVKPDTRLVGLDREMEDLTEYLAEGSICLLTGSLGAGKTSMLKALLPRLKRKHRAVYLNAENLPEDFEIQGFIRSQRTFFERLLRRQPRNLILMLDEGHMTSHEFKDELKVLFDEGVIKGLVVAQVKPPYTFSESLKHRMGGNVVKLPRLTDGLVSELVKVRTRGKHPFDEESLKTIGRHADYNPRMVLAYCKAVAKEGARRKLEEIPPALAEEILSALKLRSYPDSRIPVSAGVPGRVELGELPSFTATQKSLVRVLLEGDASSKELADVLSTTESALKEHLTGLVECGVIQQVSKRPETYSVSAELVSDLLELQ